MDARRGVSLDLGRQHYGSFDRLGGDRRRSAELSRSTCRYDEHWGAAERADTRLRCGDGVLHHVHSQLLSLWSPVLRDMLSLYPMPHLLESTHGPAYLLHVEEPAAAWAALLDTIYPLPSPPRLDWHALESCLLLADKYCMTSLLPRLAAAAEEPGRTFSMDPADAGFALRWLSLGERLRLPALAGVALRFLQAALPGLGAEPGGTTSLLAYAQQHLSKEQLLSLLGAAMQAAATSAPPSHVSQGCYMSHSDGHGMWDAAAAASSEAAAAAGVQAQQAHTQAAAAAAAAAAATTTPPARLYACPSGCHVRAAGGSLCSGTSSPASGVTGAQPTTADGQVVHEALPSSDVEDRSGFGSDGGDVCSGTADDDMDLAPHHQQDDGGLHCHKACGGGGAGGVVVPHSSPGAALYLSSALFAPCTASAPTPAAPVPQLSLRPAAYAGGGASRGRLPSVAEAPSPPPPTPSGSFGFGGAAGGRMQSGSVAAGAAATAVAGFGTIADFMCSGALLVPADGMCS